MKKLNTRLIRKNKIKKGFKPLSMLTCYDFQTAGMLNETDLDLILVGDSVGNVVLGYETTVEVTLNDMITFGSAVKRGAKNKFVVVDLPFGTYGTLEDGVKNAMKLFQETKAESVKLEGAFDFQLPMIERMTQIGIPVMGHIGLTPQSVHEMGGYFTHGKNDFSAKKLIESALNLEKAGCFAIVLECVEKDLATEITDMLSIPTIGIGSGDKTDGQVLVTNDLLHMGKKTPPKFCQPVTNMFETKKEFISQYISSVKNTEGQSESLHH